MLTCSLPLPSRRSNLIGDQGFTKLCSAIAGSATLVELDAEWNSIRDGAPLAACLRANVSLRAVSLQWNKIGNTGASAIAKALVPPLRPPKEGEGPGYNATLQFLNLGYCEIGEGATCIDLGRAVQQSPSLCRLVVSGNQLGEVGALQILSGAHDESKLVRVEMKACGLSRNGIIPLDVVCPDAASPLCGKDNIAVLREVSVIFLVLSPAHCLGRLCLFLRCLVFLWPSPGCPPHRPLRIHAPSRQICPEILGRMAFPAPPKPLTAPRVKALWEVLEDRRGGWNNKVKVERHISVTGKLTAGMSPADVAPAKQGASKQGRADVSVAKGGAVAGKGVALKGKK